MKARHARCGNTCHCCAHSSWPLAIYCCPYLQLELPSNPLDALIDQLGGPSQVGTGTARLICAHDQPTNAQVAMRPAESKAGVIHFDLAHLTQLTHVLPALANHHVLFAACSGGGDDAAQGSPCFAHVGQSRNMLDPLLFMLSFCLLRWR